LWSAKNLADDMERDEKSAIARLPYYSLEGQNYDSHRLETELLWLCPGGSSQSVHSVFNFSSGCGQLQLLL
jgi:hypothetical protein